MLTQIKRIAKRWLRHSHNGKTNGSAGAGYSTAPEGSDEHRVSEHWGKQFEEMRNSNSYWTNNRIVEEHVYRLLTDAPGHWLPWVLNTYFKDHPRFERSFSLCCGDGAHEIELYKSGKVKFVYGFDISEGALQQARAKFEQAGAPESSYRFDIKDANNLVLEDKFDLILSTGALHHVTNLEDLLAKIHRLLLPNGYFVVLEFIGPNRFQWTDQQLAVINSILGALDPCFLKDQKRVTFGRPTVEEMIALDPSEAVRSSEVYPLVKKHFSVKYERFYNGTIIHQLHPLLATHFANQGHKSFDSIIRLVLLMEDLLIKGGVLPSDFVLMICQA